MPDGFIAYEDELLKANHRLSEADINAAKYNSKIK